jgi:hypothetical protein
MGFGEQQKLWLAVLQVNKPTSLYIFIMACPCFAITTGLILNKIYKYNLTLD